jgi:valyl-tRNA synthetase
MPFITEEIWLALRDRTKTDGETIMSQPYPQASDEFKDDDAESEMKWVMQFILGIRQIRGEMDISPGKVVPVVLQNASRDDRTYADRHSELLVRVGRVESVRPLADDEEPPPSATALLGDMRVLVPLKGIIDVDAERTRLEKKQDGFKNDLGKAEVKLGNLQFMSKAPKAVVTEIEQRAGSLKDQIAKLQEQLEKLENLD